MTRERIVRQTLADQIAEQLRSEILAGQFGPGDPLPSQRHLASEFGTSTNVVREALRTLQADGLIEVHHGAGMFVNNLPQRFDTESLDPDTLLEARCMLEVGAVERVIQRIDENGLARFDAILERAAGKIAAGLPVLEEEMDFHRTLLELSGNVAIARLARIIEEFFRQAIVGHPPEKAGVYPDFVVEHRQIVDMIRAGDVPAARRTLCAHIIAGKPG